MPTRSTSDVNGGYGMLPNAIPDLYMPIVSDIEYKVLGCIVRKTLGWQKLWDAIPLSQFEIMTGNSRPAIVHAIDGLIEKTIILCNKGQGRSSSEYMLNPGHDSFDVAVNHFNQLTKFTSKADLLLAVNQINCYASVVVNQINTQKKGFKNRSKNNNNQSDDNDSAIAEEGKENGTLGNGRGKHRNRHERTQGEQVAKEQRRWEVSIHSRESSARTGRENNANTSVIPAYLDAEENNISKTLEHDRAAPANSQHMSSTTENTLPTKRPGHIETDIETRTRLALAISAVWGIAGRCTDNSIQKAIDEFRGDPEPLFNACRLIAAKDNKPDIKHSGAAIKYLVKVAQGNGSPVKYWQARRMDNDPEIDKLIKAIRYYSEFRQYRDQVYPALCELSTKTGKSVEKWYEELEFLPAGELNKFKTIAKG